MIQFYAPGLPDDLMLPEGEASHAVRVLRMQPGNEAVCVDGRGTRYFCRIADVRSKRCSVEVERTETVTRPWPADITVAVAPTKHLDRMEWLVEKLVEIGIDRIVPLLAERSERRELKTERLEKIAVSAMKQSLKATMPVIEPMTRLRTLIEAFPDGCGVQRFFAYCDPSIPRRLFTCEYTPGKPVLIVIGPEGDFSPVEISLALDAGFVPVSLGDVRLRTETAALYAVMAAHAINGTINCETKKE